MPKRKNVILIFGDDTVSDIMAGMPYLASEPGGSWVKFPQGINSTPICGPSRVTLHTGRGAWSHGIANNVQADEVLDGGQDPQKMLGRSLQKAGVTTCFVGKYINGYPWVGFGGSASYVPPGWHYWRAAKGEDLYGYTVVNRDLSASSVTAHGSADADYLTDVEATQVAGFAGSLPEPFFMTWASRSPHRTPGEVYPPAPRHATAPVTLVDKPNFNEADISDKPSWVQERYPTPLDQATVDTYRASHENVLRMSMSFDEGIQGLINALTARGILEDTVIIFAGDNSNCFGEHRHYTKTAPYEECLDMVLRVRWPGHTGGTSQALISHIDLAPTIADILGARLPVAPDGMSFAPVLAGTVAAADFRREVLLWREEETPRQFGVGTYRGIRTQDGRKYVHHTTDGDHESYTLATDPHELASGGLDTELADRMDRLSAAT